MQALVGNVLVAELDHLQLACRAPRSSAFRATRRPQDHRMREGLVFERDLNPQRL
jgi:hypothetical protein